MHPTNGLQMIVARARNGTIGDQDGLPWKLSADLARFKWLTMGHAILMGRKTYESIGRLLPGRQTIILSRQSGYHVEGAQVFASIEQAVDALPSSICPFVVGGAEIYQLVWPLVQGLHITHVLADLSGDTQLDPFPMRDFRLVESEWIGADERNEWPTCYEYWTRNQTSSV